MILSTSVETCPRMMYVIGLDTTVWLCAEMTLHLCICRSFLRAWYVSSHSAARGSAWRRLKATRRRKPSTRFFLPKAQVLKNIVKCSFRLSTAYHCSPNAVCFCNAVTEGFTLDIVRELAFISTDGGVTWRAEVSTHLLLKCTFTMLSQNV